MTYRFLYLSLFILSTIWIHASSDTKIKIETPLLPIHLNNLDIDCYQSTLNSILDPLKTKKIQPC